jgi:hypothetical protein
MTSRDFCFWLQGYFELTKDEGLTNEQVELVRRHLDLVFKHEIDPSMGPKKHQEALDAIHHTMPHSHPHDPLVRC